MAVLVRWLFTATGQWLRGAEIAQVMAVGGLVTTQLPSFLTM